MLFAKIRESGKPVTMLEIGVFKGGSCELWKKYLPQSSIIHGIDINPECAKIPFSENIVFHLGSASDRVFMEKTFCSTEFDIILDDGSHRCDDVIKTFEIMFPKLKRGGTYIVEDLCTSYWNEFGGGLRKKKSSIEYFKRLIDEINADYAVLGRRGGLTTRILRYGAKKLGLPITATKPRTGTKQRYSYYGENVESISFYDMICAIRKYSTPKLYPNKPVFGGYGKDVKNYIDFIEGVKAMYGGQ